MNPGLYFPVFIISMSIYALIYGSKYLSSGNYLLQEKGNNSIFGSLIICLFLVFWLGQRPISAAFGDTMSYFISYNQIDDTSEVLADWSSEWIWSLLFHSCHAMGLSIHSFFTIIEAGYILTAFAAVVILMPKNVLLAMLFVFTSFSFFTFGVNGLRNGLAVHICLLGFALYLKGLRITSALMFLTAFGIHRSVIIPIGAFLAAIFLIKSDKTSILIWFSSIFLSFISGGFFTSFFAGLGFDDRASLYLDVEGGNSLDTSSSAFRWDFLLYSAMPILMMWLTTIKENVTDNWYNVLARTYCFSNSFWILVIRASFSNRFAYLSWFLYPIIIAYPLIMLPVWDNQDMRTGIVLYMYVFLTLGICYLTGML